LKGFGGEKDRAGISERGNVGCTVLVSNTNPGVKEIKWKNFWLV